MCVIVMPIGNLLLCTIVSALAAQVLCGGDRPSVGGDLRDSVRGVLCGSVYKDGPHQDQRLPHRHPLRRDRSVYYWLFLEKQVRPLLVLWLLARSRGGRCKIELNICTATPVEIWNCAYIFQRRCIHTHAP